HGRAPLLAASLHRAELAKVLPVHSRRHLRETLERNRYRTRRHVREALCVAAELERAGLVAGCTKGVAVQATLYDEAGTRAFNDIDLMVLPEQRRAVAEVLAGVGY